MDAAATVDEFIKAWGRLDPDELAGYFTEDATYHNIPIMPVTGRQEIRDFIAGFVGPFTGAEFTVHHQAVHGDTVLNERTDVFTFPNGNTLEILVMGVFELRDGKIHAWRDYFDLAAVTKALAENSG
ncbi:limonene-1,2-epoxide hydrolase family protein [Streptodolium elevatio]|uniref:Limonene-1,2-epoxide hydrolase family protein n=1 Tax=Streptodolium elevatio TaxID=3157996 RepID=A0ABV3D917_9ACTN